MGKNYSAMLCVLFVALATVACCSSMSSRSNPKKQTLKFEPDSVSLSQLGEKVAASLFNPDKVNCWSLKCKSEVKETDFQVEPHFVRDTLLAVLKPEQLSILQFLLLSEGDNYQNDTIIVSAPYIPRIEFEFIKKKSSTVHIVVSMSDFSWSMICDDKRQFNYNYSEKRQINRFCRGFLEK